MNRQDKIFSAFARGHKVDHSLMGAGEVTDVTDHYIEVKYDESLPSGAPNKGRYTRQWFKLFPHTLRIVTSHNLLVSA